ncbi:MULTISPECIES: septum site-determining protein MinC [unclassified Clostridium]|jgi:septum site-determining protein MinC|uniref:septum site-determining protein MinC n=1 Tax=Clostridium TaxID=1485 RepID=UPI001C8B8315|nr:MULTISPECIES: septum site-determining protein MinC [unclassified Clostridium]MBX9136549.1 septum site-determining protein MinC [Clostridium sp. K12(2020)]MBX9142970.1 septum site-determining protein MinC [Clostridium sp. K13]MDU2291842.1 septum site-determining protein MinC [Clostridium celatum]MDU4325549.1 septum site-determining protein MinC [Clostridium celatum]
MKDERIQIRGNKDGVNVIIDMNKFICFDNMLEVLVNSLSKNKSFYKNSILKITANLKHIDDSEIAKLKEELFQKINIKDCIFDDINEVKENNSYKVFNGINEGKTKFIKKTIRGGQSIDYPGNIIIIGDINSGAEVSAGGNIIVLGSIKGNVRAGTGGNKKSIIAAFFMQPELMQISDILTISPDDGLKPSYPEVAKIKDGYIVVEPYLPNKYIY